MTTWTHTATVTRTYPIGAEQLGHTVKAGDTVELYKDPALQQGDVITVRKGRDTGRVRIAHLRNVARKSA